MGTLDFKKKISALAVKKVEVYGPVRLEIILYSSRYLDVCCRLHESCGDDGAESANDEVRHRTRIECDEFWVTVHSMTNTGHVELVAGRADRTAVAVTRRPSDGGFDVFARDAVRDGRPVLEYCEEDGTVMATAADGTRVIANFGDLDEFVCEIYVSDGTKIRTRRRVDAAVEYCPAGGDRVPATKSCGVRDKYLVCRRDLSGYEFVDDENNSESVQGRQTEESSDDVARKSVVRTLTPSPLDDRTVGLVDKALSVHLKTVGKLADRLQVDAEKGPEDRPIL